MAHEPPKYAKSPLVSVVLDFIKSYRIFIIFIGLRPFRAVFDRFRTALHGFRTVFFRFFASWRHGGAAAPSRRRHGRMAPPQRQPRSPPATDSGSAESCAQGREFMDEKETLGMGSRKAAASGMKKDHIRATVAPLT